METTEFTLEGFTDYCKLKWSKPRLAKNLNWYRKAEPTEIFWEWYNGEDNDPGLRKQHKEFLKRNGITIYKEYGKFGIFDWNNKEQGSQEEYDKQKEQKEKDLCPLLLEELLNACTKESPKDYEIAKEELQKCKTLEDLEDYAKYKILYGEAIIDKVLHNYSLL